MIDWVHSMIEDQLKARFYGNPSMKKKHYENGRITS